MNTLVLTFVNDPLVGIWVLMRISMRKVLSLLRQRNRRADKSFIETLLFPAPMPSLGSGPQRGTAKAYLRIGKIFQTIGWNFISTSDPIAFCISAALGVPLASSLTFECVASLGTALRKASRECVSIF